jgi:hypothetical protein
MELHIATQINGSTFMQQNKSIPTKGQAFLKALQHKEKDKPNVTYP